jgi:hypothetical protein
MNGGRGRRARARRWTTRMRVFESPMPWKGALAAFIEFGAKSHTKKEVLPTEGS